MLLQLLLEKCLFLVITFNHRLFSFTLLIGLIHLVKFHSRINFGNWFQLVLLFNILCCEIVLVNSEFFQFLHFVFRKPSVLLDLDFVVSDKSCNKHLFRFFFRLRHYHLLLILLPLKHFL